MEKIKSINEFIYEIEIFEMLSLQTIFRGQPVQGNLIPSVARNEREKDTTKSEKEALKQLKLLGASYCSYDTDLDWLVMAQHFGLKTRLLDWTSNPLIALWFACSDESKNDAYVYFLDAKSLLIEDAYDEDPFSLKKTIVFQPRMNNARIIAQNGWFTLHRHSAKNRKFVSLEKNESIKNRIEEVCIAGDKKKQILGSLDLMGINSKTIYPDLQGLCKYLNIKHSL